MFLWGGFIAIPRNAKMLDLIGSWGRDGLGENRWLYAKTGEWILN
jgi:hypothetical protein